MILKHVQLLKGRRPLLDPLPLVDELSFMTFHFCVIRVKWNIYSGRSSSYYCTITTVDSSPAFTTVWPTLFWGWSCPRLYSGDRCNPLRSPTTGWKKAIWHQTVVAVCCCFLFLSRHKNDTLLVEQIDQTWLEKLAKTTQWAKHIQKRDILNWIKKRAKSVIVSKKEGFLYIFNQQLTLCADRPI